MPCWELFDEQEEIYKNQVLSCNKDTLLVSLEAGVTTGWEKYTGRNGLNLGINTFGESAPGVDVANHFGLVPQKVSQAIIERMNKK